MGVSTDGDRPANDRHRRFANGASSVDQVRAALALLCRPECRELYASILCTIDVRNPPEQVYEALLAERPPCIDFLLPHTTWDEPPYRPGNRHTPTSTAPAIASLILVYRPDLRFLVERTNEESSIYDADRKQEETGAAEAIAQLESGFGDEATIGWLAEQQPRCSTTAL